MDLPAAGDPTKRMISGDDDGGMMGRKGGLGPVEDGMLFKLADVVWNELFAGFVDTGI